MAPQRTAALVAALLAVASCGRKRQKPRAAPPGLRSGLQGGARVLLTNDAETANKVATVACPGSGCFLTAPITCPPHCSGWGRMCRNRRCMDWNYNRKGPPQCLKHEPIQSYVNYTMQLLWSHYPRSANGTASPGQKQLILITTTFPHNLQMIKLQHCMTVLTQSAGNVFWIVAEDAAQPSAEVTALLRASGLPHVHIAHGPTRKGGNAQRNIALKLIRRRRMSGVVYNMDDDNSYHPQLWGELRKLGPMKVGVFALRRGIYPPPVCDGTVGPLDKSWNRVGGRKMLIERPSYNRSSGRFMHWSAGWCDPKSWLSQRRGVRKYCVDMGAFAFDAALLHRAKGEPWTYQGHGGESELIDRLLPGGRAEDLQPLANCGQDVLVFHNEYRVIPRALHWPPASCATDGWGVGAARDLSA